MLHQLCFVSVDRVQLGEDHPFAATTLQLSSVVQVHHAQGQLDLALCGTTSTSNPEGYGWREGREGEGSGRESGKAGASARDLEKDKLKRDRGKHCVKWRDRVGNRDGERESFRRG